MRDYLIYGLVDPRTSEVRYVGKTKCGMKRPKQHTHPKRLEKDQTHKGNWIRQLLKAGVGYEVVVLEDDVIDLTWRERVWIAYGKGRGWPLTNMTGGGESGPDGYKFTLEHRAKISAALKGKSGVKRSAKHAAALRRSRLGKRNSPEHCERIRKGLMGHPVSKATREKLKKASSKPVVDLESGKVYSSQVEVAEELNLCLRSVNSVLRGRLRQTGGHRFSYA